MRISARPGATSQTLKIAVVLTVAACDYTPNGPAVPSPSPSTNVVVLSPVPGPLPTPITFCPMTLEDFCGGRCPTLSESEASLQQECASVPRFDRPSSLLVHCPGIYYATLWSEAHTNSWRRLTFNGSGTMIGAWAFSEGKEFCGGRMAEARAGDYFPGCPDGEQSEPLCQH